MDPTVFVNPPLYSAIAVTNFLAVIFGIIFKDMLEYRVAEWQQNRAQQEQVNYRRPSLILTYLGCCLSLVAFIAACLMVIGFPLSLAAITGGVLVLLTGGLIWWQLGGLLQLLVYGGSEAIDIDSYGAGELFDSQAPDPK